MSDIALAGADMTHVWHVTYETAVLSRWPSESGAWVAHDRAVIQGLDPDKLAVVAIRTCPSCGAERPYSHLMQFDGVCVHCFRKDD